MALIAHTNATLHKGKRGARGGCGCDPPDRPRGPTLLNAVGGGAAAEEGTARSDPLREVVRVIRASNEGPLSSNDN